jgi:YHS domain-containing protein
MRNVASLAAGIACGMALAAAADADALVDPVNKNRSGVALKGYDVVAYFNQQMPVKGSAQFSQEWMGAVWRFSSPRNRAEFTADPARFAPQFGGYCSWAVSHGYTADVDPAAWKIVDGKLYLNYSKGVQKKWEQDMPRRIEEGNRNWPRLHK